MAAWKVLPWGGENMKSFRNQFKEIVSLERKITMTEFILLPSKLKPNHFKIQSLLFNLGLYQRGTFLSRFAFSWESWNTNLAFN